MNNFWWNIGGGIKHSKQLIDFNNYLKQYYDVPYNFFNSVYDSIFGMLWNGGRICQPQDTITLEEWIELIYNYNFSNIGFNFSFSNRLLQPEHLDDKYCNLMLSAANEKKGKMNGVILTSEILAEHVRENYPNLKIIYSVCNGLNKVEDYNQKCEKYDIVVLHPDFNHNLDFLSQLIYKDKIEIMVNDICSFGCPYRAKHYDWLSQCALVQAHNPIIHNLSELDKYRVGGCEAIQNGYQKDNRNKLSFYDLDILSSMGFSKFKLIGREHEWEDFKKIDLIPYLDQYRIRKIIQDNNLHRHI